MQPTLEAVAEQLGGAPRDKAESDSDRLKKDLDAFLKTEEVYRTPREEMKERAREKPAKKETPAEKPEKAPEQEKGSDEPEAKDPEPKKNPDADKARDRLKLAGHPTAAIDALDDDTVIGWWSKQNEREYNADQAFRRANDLQKQLDDAVATKEAEPQAVPTAELDLAPLSQLEEHLGEEGSKALTEAVKQVLTPLQATLLGHIKNFEALQASLSEAQEQSAQAVSKDNRDRLGEVVPRLMVSDTAWKQVENIAAEMIVNNGSGYKTANEVFDAAVSELYGPEVFSAKEDADIKAQINASTPTTQTKRQTKKTLSPYRS